MESSDPHTGAREHRRLSGISPQTLIIASVASAAASFTVARVWGPGTLIGAAAAPVIVALVAEFLRRPMRTVAATAKRVPKARIMPGVRDRTSAPLDHAHVQSEPIRMGTGSPSGTDLGSTPAPLTRRAGPPGTVDALADPGTNVHANDITRGRLRWRVAVATGLLAFAVVVGAFTVPDLVAGHSITGNGRQTTFFGSSPIIEKTTSPTTTVTITTPATPTSTAPRTTTAQSATTVTTPTRTATTPTDTQTTTTPTTSTTPITTPPTTTAPATTAPITAPATNNAPPTTEVP
ncbi:MAG: hypothetical protein ACLP8S_31130 [Solirubrobacteraceae bacterium]